MFPTMKQLIQWVGKTHLDHIESSTWRDRVKQTTEAFQVQFPTAERAEIKGSRPHISHDDPTDPAEVISIRMFDLYWRRLASIHVHEDGSYKVAHRKREWVPEPKKEEVNVAEPQENVAEPQVTEPQENVAKPQENTA
ncbi:hypothetical protein C8Q74DRAFT_1372042 [Fomes fomentarius]|nr:hypothetical protein C8Q74DRAFT_1372042 [Fomes fomentarius]